MVTLITGATSGIGEQLAIKYAQMGDTVIACGRNTEKLAELSKHNNIESCKFDATSLKDIKEATNNPLTLTVINFNLLFFLEVKNWEIAKNKDSQSAKFPKEGAIS